MPHRFITLGLLLAMLPTLVTAARLPGQSSADSPITVEVIINDLRNPRGVAVFPDGRLLVAQAGDGIGTSATGGQISIYADLNGDGSYEETEVVMCCVAGYNALTHYGTGQDEVGGLGDVLLLEDGRVFYTQDDPLSGYLPDGTAGRIAVLGLTPAPEWRRYEVITRGATMNALAYDPAADLLYVAESGLNRISAVTLDGELTPLVEHIPDLANGQQSVPAGLARDPRSGDLLVALLSGQIRDYFDTVIAYMPEAALIIRLDPSTGEWREEITGLTTAVDVAVDDAGNIYVVEMATGWPTTQMPRTFPLRDPDAPPDSGGYPRFSGRVTMYLADGGAPLRLAEGLDMPTNITYHAGALYVSVGQGTPGRAIIGPEGRTRITGQLIRITGFRQ
jgi:hypothetical protein